MLGHRTEGRWFKESDAIHFFVLVVVEKFMHPFLLNIKILVVFLLSVNENCMFMKIIVLVPKIFSADLVSWLEPTKKIKMNVFWQNIDVIQIDK